jgi:hypothetical protein
MEVPLKAVQDYSANLTYSITASWIISGLVLKQRTYTGVGIADKRSSRALSCKVIHSDKALRKLPMVNAPASHAVSSAIAPFCYFQKLNQLSHARQLDIKRFGACLLEKRYTIFFLLKDLQLLR